MPKWNFVAMGQVGLTGWTRAAAQPVARSIARRTGRPEAQILSLIGAAFLAIALINFLREVDAVIAAGRTGRQPANDARDPGAVGAEVRLGGLPPRGKVRPVCLPAVLLACHIGGQSRYRADNHGHCHPTHELASTSFTSMNACRECA